MKGRVTLPLDFEKEEETIERDIRWATEEESRVISEAKRALRRLDDRRKTLESELEDLQQKNEHLLGIIEGKIKPSAVDLPQEEADDFKTKLRLRIKGVRGIAIEKAKEDLIPLDEKITKLEGKIERLNAKAKPVEEKMSKTTEALGNFERVLREQRSYLRKTRSAHEDVGRMTGIFGWYNPYLLERKVLEEISLSRWRLESKRRSVNLRKEEIVTLENGIKGIKDELRSSLGEAYELSFIPIVFKSGRSPEGKRFERNEITLRDVDNLDVKGKIAHHKSLGRKADRLSSVVAERTFFILESLHRIGRLCEERVYNIGILERSRTVEKIAKSQLQAKVRMGSQVLAIAENCRLLFGQTDDYLEKKESVAASRERAEEILGQIRSDLLKI